jgi:hypothetical protein
LHHKVPHLLGLVFTFLVNIKINDILELDQWNHPDALGMEKVMHHTCFDVIKFDRLGGLKQI